MQGVVAVTGASRGIGAAIACELARRSVRVACLTRSGELPQAEPALQQNMIAVRCDVTNEESVRAALAMASVEQGGLAGLVNNAGIRLDGASHRFTTAQFDEVMATNARSVFVACREAYPHLAARGGGVIVNIGSFFDKLGVKKNLAYCASKAAVGAITRCLAVEWADKNIRVIDVAPGYVETDMNRDALARGPLAMYLAKRIPSGRAGRAADVAVLVAALVTGSVPFLTGETIYVDGAQSIAH